MDMVIVGGFNNQIIRLGLSQTARMEEIGATGPVDSYSATGTGFYRRDPEGVPMMDVTSWWNNDNK